VQVGDHGEQQRARRQSEHLGAVPQGGDELLDLGVVQLRPVGQEAPDGGVVKVGHLHGHGELGCELAVIDGSSAGHDDLSIRELARQILDFLDHADLILMTHLVEAVQQDPQGSVLERPLHKGTRSLQPVPLKLLVDHVDQGQRVAVQAVQLDQHGQVGLRHPTIVGPEQHRVLQ
jgi:hypothetical protein